MDDNKKKALAAALGQIEKQFGKGSVMRLGDAGPSRDIETISTGCLSLDVALGIGGLPKERDNYQRFRQLETTKHNGTTLDR